MPIYQEKNKKKWTKDGRSWYFRCYYTDMYGNKKQKVSKMYKKSKDCADAEREFLVKVKTNNEIDFNVLFNDICIEWLYFKKNTVKSSTYYCIKKRVYKHIISFFDRFKLQSIKINVLNTFKDTLAKTNLNTESQNKIIGYLQEILDYAVKNYDFDIKIASKLQKYKVEKVKTKLKDSEINYWTYEEFTKFIENVDNDFYSTLFNFLYYTGLRYGEMCALKWNDIDFERKELTVNKTLTVKIDGGGYAITTPKTENSNRIIDLSDNVIKQLKKHFEHEKKIYSFNTDMFIFGNIRFLAPTTFRNNLKKYTVKAKVKEISPHGFRHSHASLLIDLGCDSREVAERLGDTVEMVEKTYYHMFPKKKKHTINVLNNLEK